MNTDRIEGIDGILGPQPGPSKHGGTKRLSAEAVQPVQEPAKFDPEGTISKMDRLWNTNFKDWVKKQENAECSGQHLAAMLEDFDINRAAWGIRWIVSNPSWHINNIATLINVATASWPLKQRAKLANLVSNDWPLSPYTTRLVYHMMDRLQYDKAVELIAGITETWTIDSALQLVAELGHLYQWEKSLFGAIALRLAWNFKKNRYLSAVDNQHLNTFCNEAHSGSLDGHWLQPGVAEGTVVANTKQ